MKIGMKEINDGIYMVAINKLRHSLEKEGFSVSSGGKDDLFDLYAEKDDDRRIYEIRIGKNKIQQRLISKMQKIAKEKGAKLYVTYLEQPRTSRIEYDGIENLLLDYLINNMPGELDALSTHTMPQEVYDLEIDSISINNDMIKIEGNASLGVELLYGSEHDRSNDFGDKLNDSFEFMYRAKIIHGQIDYAYFKFDLEHFYN